MKTKEIKTVKSLIDQKKKKKEKKENRNIIVPFFPL
jgi:hypothetical protein